MSKHIVTLEEYIKQIKADNIQDDNSDVRLNFFRLKKLNQILLLKKSVSCGPASYFRTTASTIRPLLVEQPISNINPRALTPQELEYLINSNLHKILINDTYPAAIGKLDTTLPINPKESDTLFIDQLMVSPEYRNMGIATALMSEVKSSALNNGIPYIGGEILPMDEKAFELYVKGHTPLALQILNYLSYKTGLLKKKAFVDINSLRKIYEKLGFNIKGSDLRTLNMEVNKLSISEEEQLPQEFTHYKKNKDTTIIYR